MNKTEEVEASNVINFTDRLKFNYQEPPGKGNWLSKLPKGTRFLASETNSYGPILGDFLVASDPQEMKAVLVGFELASPQGGFRFVDPVKFSQKYSHYMTLEVEIEDGNSNSVQEGTMDSDGECQVIDPVHEGQ